MKIFAEAINLILKMDFTLTDILSVTFKMSISSSIISLILGVPIGILYGYKDFKFKNVMIIINRTLMGTPPVVCGLFCYLMFSGVGPMRHFKLLYTIKGMVIAQVLLITPIVVGTLEPFVRKLYPEMKDTLEGINIKGIKKILLLINESKYELVDGNINYNNGNKNIEIEIPKIDENDYYSILVKLPDENERFVYETINTPKFNQPIWLIVIIFLSVPLYLGIVIGIIIFVFKQQNYGLKEKILKT